MLSISAMRGAGQGNYYLNLAREDYYTGGGEPPGLWAGSAAEALSLTGQVEPNQLENLLRGYTEEGHELVRNAGAESRQSGWDLTFSAPKTVSVLWSQAGEEVRRAIQDAQQIAVETALAAAEQMAGKTRRGAAGAVVEPAKLVFATFEHATSRELDPQLHTHALLLNVGVREDGSTGSIVSQRIYRLKMALGALYRAEFAYQLTRSVGCEITPTQTGFEIAGVPAELAESFSTRRAQIKSTLTKLRVTGAEAAKVVALETRKNKEAVPRAELFAKWQEQAKERGWTAEQAAEIAPGPGLIPKGSAHEIIAEAVEKRSRAQSFFSAGEVLREAADLAPGRGVSADGLCKAWKDITDQKLVIPIGERYGQERFATLQTLDEERALMTAVKAGQGDSRFMLNPFQVLERLDERGNRNLSQEQRQAIHHITTEAGSISVVSGLAGTGKSTLLKIAQELWQESGFKVVGTALSGKAAQGLTESAGIKSCTIAKALHDLEEPKKSGLKIVQEKLFPKAPKWSPFHALTAPRLKLVFEPAAFRMDEKTILVVDEAGMVDTKKMRALVDAAREAKAKIVLVGDERQLQPIEAGAPFAAIGKEIGRAEVTEVVRQQDGWARQAVKDLGQGSINKGLRAYAERGHVHEQATEAERRAELFAEWQRGGLKYPEKTLILTGTRADAGAMNAEAQALRQKAGRLGKESVLTGENERIFEKDRVVFTKNARIFGVNNGTFGTLEEVKGKFASFALDDGRKTLIPTDALGGVALGYASTTHKAQGATVPRVLVLVDEKMQDQQLTYVQASRASKEAKFFVTSKQGIFDASAKQRTKESIFTPHQDHKREMEYER